MTSIVYLKSLELQNFATFSLEKIYFSHNLNVIFGETGSGKSLIIEALGLIFEKKYEKKYIRKETDKAIIEAEFFILNQDLINSLSENGIDLFNNTLVIKKEIYKNKSSILLINNKRIHSNIIKEIAESFIHFIDQFENQKLLNADFQINLLDTFSDLKKELSNYKIIYNTLNDLNKKIETEKNLLNYLENNKDFFLYQLKEIEQVSPSIEEEKELLRKKDNILLLQKNIQDLKKIYDLLGIENEINLTINLNSIISIIQKNKLIINSDLKEKLLNTYEYLEELSYFTQKELEKSTNDEEIHSLILKIESYQKLKKKYGPECQDILKYESDLRSKINSIDLLQKNIINLESQIKNLEAIKIEKANQLHQKRISHKDFFVTKINHFLKQLNMPKAIFGIEIIQLPYFSNTGYDLCKFTICANPGEGTHEIKSIASGGELSRILLAIYATLEEKTRPSILVFDEIDSGVDEKTAEILATFLKNLSTHCQILTISHLDQVKKVSDQLNQVEKKYELNNNLTRTHSIVKNVKAAPTKELSCQL